MKKIFRATKDRSELSAFISIIIAMPVAIAVNDFNPDFFMFFVFPCSFIFLRYDDYSHHYLKYWEIHLKWRFH